MKDWEWTKILARDVAGGLGWNVDRLDNELIDEQIGYFGIWY